MTNLVTNLKNKNWYIIDASGNTLGRLTTEVVKIVLGKHKVNYLPYTDNGDCVIVINAKSVKITGKKEVQKIYYNHSGHPGGLKGERFIDLQTRFPERILEQSIRGMLPKNILGRLLFKNVKIYSERFHPHKSQNPKLIELGGKYYGGI